MKSKRNLFLFLIINLGYGFANARQNDFQISRSANFFAEAIHTIQKISDNFHTVQKGQLYRSKQLSPKKFYRYVKYYNLKTIINLRGKNKDKRWWIEEKNFCKRNQLGFFNISMSAKTYPTKENILKLLKLFKFAKKPILIHCYGGSDRTGEASALWKLIIEKKTKKEALKQLQVKFGHLKFLYPKKREFIEKLNIIW